MSDLRIFHQGPQPMEEKLSLLRLVLPSEAARTSELRGLPGAAGGAFPLSVLRSSMGPADWPTRQGWKRWSFPPEPFKALQITP